MSLKGEAKKEYQKDYMKKKRSTIGSNKEVGLTSKTGVNAVIPEGVNIYRYIDNKRIELKEVPEGCKVLSDGQAWKPSIVYAAPLIRPLIHNERHQEMQEILESTG